MQIRIAMRADSDCYTVKPAVNGMLFDPIKLQYFYEEAVKNKEREYVLICQDWQK